MAQHTEFPAYWWDDRRKRDYYVDEAGEVRLRPDSPTGEKVSAKLVAIAEAIAERMAGRRLDG